MEQEGYAAATISDEDVGDVSLVLDMVLDEDLLSRVWLETLFVEYRPSVRNSTLMSKQPLASVWIEGLDLADLIGVVQSEVRARTA